MTSEPLPSQDKGGCLKVAAIGVPILLLIGFLIWKVAQASGRAEEVAARVTTPYLELVKQGQYQQALDKYGSDEHKKNVSAEKLKTAYGELIREGGPLGKVEVVLAQEEHQLFGDSIVQVRYRIHQERFSSLVVYDIAGEGDAAKIRQSYERPAGRDVLVPAAR